MIARCARCQGTFTTDRFGVQTCPHCGSEILLADPGQPAAPSAPAAPPAPAGEPSWGAPPPPAPEAAPPLPPPAPPPAAPPQGAGWSQPSGGWSPPPPYGPPPYGGGPGGPGGYGGPGGPGPGAPFELSAPFAERATRGFFPAFFETFKLVATQPAELFRRVRIDQTGSAVLFGVLAATVGSAAAAVYGYLSGAASLAAMQEMVQQMPEEQARFMRFLTQGMTGTMAIAQIVLAPLFALIGIYLHAAIVHLVLLLLRGAPRGFDATLTVVGYATGLELLLALPGCGGVVALVWYLVVLVIGLGEAQRCGAGKAAAAVLAPVLLACVCCCGALGLGGAGFVKSLQQAAEAAKGQGTSL